MSAIMLASSGAFLACSLRPGAHEAAGVQSLAGEIQTRHNKGMERNLGREKVLETLGRELLEQIEDMTHGLGDAYEY